ncbi:Spore germination protein A1 [Paraliobacillus sp. PM-2]|uniref:spore germination protein n=1 Tax=Paraliobacillus sp. PM-2 TaxID=1462524 RepID=UPI00061C6AF8|nr:spore germination protein [Paraliobacillus sp. PM-2]CQR48302.1 Spore germination protein A1 [Paraliobacillus sp. PM-2]
MAWNLLKPKKQKKKKKQTATKQSKQGQNPLSTNLSDNKNQLRSIYQDCSDFILRSFMISGKHQAILIYMDGLSNREEIDDNVLSPLMVKTQEDQSDLQIDKLIKNRVSISDVKEVKTIEDCIQLISSGNPVVLVNNSKTGFSVGLPQWEKRSIEAPEAEKAIRGPREGFVETLAVNISMLRRKIRSPKLKMQSMEIGRYTKTNVIITYIDGVVDKTLVEEVENRLKRIDIDGILDSGVIEEFIEDNPYSPFPQILETERPDTVTGNLLEGRIAILVDGSPSALIVPITFYSFLQANEDYYNRFLIATAIRWLRFILVIISLLLPSLYVALLTFHQEMIPTALLISMASSREQVPFPAIVEVLIMEITFEALREAGLRLPKQIGSAVSIVGALVIGESAVSAGIVSAPMVIVVAITGIASFTIPRYSAAIALRMLRFPLIFLGGMLGLLGIMLGIIMVIVHLSTLRSFGVPYLSPMAPMKYSEIKDTMMRAPWWKLNKRPHLTGEYNEYRQSSGQKPSPIRGKD